jgi:Ni,Fe-hydrogenase I small subunit
MKDPINNWLIPVTDWAFFILLRCKQYGFISKYDTHSRPKCQHGQVTGDSCYL